MNEERYDAFEACLAALEKGVEVDECLESYPEMAEDLQPLLETAMFARSKAEDYVPNAAFHRTRSRLLDKAALLRGQVEPRRPRLNFGRLPRMAFVALVLALIFFMSWRGAVESAQALPGDPLYPLKLRAEEVRLGIVPNASAKRAIEVTYEQRRVDEVSELLDMGRAVEVTFEGELHQRETDEWKIEGIAVSITPDTQILGDINLGEVVKVSGRTQSNGKLLAAAIQLHSYQLIGLVESIGPTQWVVSGRQLRIRRDSQIDPTARVDDRVIVLVEVDNNENLQALAILRLLQPELVATLVPATAAPEAQSGELELYGLVQAISSQAWQIAGRQVQIASATEIKEDINVGDFVKVHILVAPDGSMTAREIELDTVFQAVQPQEDQAGDFIEGEEIKDGDHSEDEDKSGSGQKDDQGIEDEDSSGGQDEEENSGSGSQSDDDNKGEHEDEEEHEDGGDEDQEDGEKHDDDGDEDHKDEEDEKEGN
jgi:hypothetical protein